jgi:hypothetical protein
MILNGPDSTKFCPDCRQEQPVSVFTKNARSRDGLAFYCASCARARVFASRRRRLGPPRSRAGQGPREVLEGQKWCQECSEVRSLDAFPRNRSQKLGVGSSCQPCHNKIVRASKELHGGARNYHLRRRYGITAEHFDLNCNGALGQFRDRTDLMLRAIADLGNDDAIGASDLPALHFGVHIGDFTDPRPEDELRVA